MASILITTDWHLGYPLWTKQMADTIDVFTEQVEKRKPDLLIHLGDVMNSTKPRGDTIEFATVTFRTLANFCGELLVIAGNHEMDRYNNVSAVDYLDDIAPNIRVITEPCLIDSLLFMPFQRQLTSRTRTAIRHADYVFAHLGCEAAPFAGTKLYGKRSDSIPLDVLKNVKQAFLGHIHQPLSEGGLHVVGAPYQLKFNDYAGKRSFIVWDTEDPDDVKRVVYKNNFYLQKVFLKVKTLDPKNLVTKIPAINDNTYYDVTVTYEELVDLKKVQAARQAIAAIYGKFLVECHVVSTVPESMRSLNTVVRKALSPNPDATPEELLATYLIKVGGPFYKNNPDLVQSAQEEFSDIMEQVGQNISERG